MLYTSKSGVKSPSTRALPTSETADLRTAEGYGTLFVFVTCAGILAPSPGCRANRFPLVVDVTPTGCTAKAQALVAERAGLQAAGQVVRNGDAYAGTGGTRARRCRREPHHQTNEQPACSGTLVSHPHGASSAAGWWIDSKTGDDLSDLNFSPYVVGTKLMPMVSELSEAMEGYRKGGMDDKLPHRSMLEVELADAVLRNANLAGKLGCDLSGASIEKMGFNTVRANYQIGAHMAAGGKAY